jgi:ABC-type transport system substrate-binding protein
MALNLAEPPFDDVHVRKAVNWIVDREAVRRIAGGALLGEIFDRTIPDVLTGDLNKGFSPYGTPGDAGDLDKAKEEMELSKYDSDQDGVCDDPVCQDVLTVAESSESPKRMAIIESNFKQIGITLDTKYFSYGSFYAKCEAPEEHVAICGSAVWVQDYPDASTFAEPLFSNVSTSNYGLVGFTPEQLKKAGYEVTEVPSVQDEIERCGRMPVGEGRLQCYADFDRMMSTEIVPWVPLRIATDVFITSNRVVNYRLDA